MVQNASPDPESNIEIRRRSSSVIYTKATTGENSVDTATVALSLKAHITTAYLKTKQNTFFSPHYIWLDLISFSNNPNILGNILAEVPGHLSPVMGASGLGCSLRQVGTNTIMEL